MSAPGSSSPRATSRRCARRSSACATTPHCAAGSARPAASLWRRTRRTPGRRACHERSRAHKEAASVNSPMRRTIFLALLAALLFAPVARATPPIDIQRDCADDGVLQGDYSASDLRKARSDLPTDADEYSDCRDVLSRAIANATGSDAGGGWKPDPGSTGGSSNGASPTPDPGAGTTTGDAPKQ